MLLLLRFAAVAQNTGSISGQVTDNNGNGIEGITLLLKENSQVAVTQPDGAYTITNLPLGEITVIVKGLL
ncbi:carboxypeptidase regulatory-like domain-containing protein [Pontibacter toksunensis]|uniref:Carboxypeptidase regulatory-like domain-containing protein n=1 Tax=Pontibacter toksunensis TaxID=1332631 RepID=A0ABW6C076_9BACT